MKLSHSVACVIVTAMGLFAPSGFAQNNPVEGSISVSGKSKKEYPNLAKISMVEAIETARAQVPGKAVEAELDDERNVLVYEVKMVADDGSTQKVVVDAGKKRVLWQERD